MCKLVLADTCQSMLSISPFFECKPTCSDIRSRINYVTPPVYTLPNKQTNKQTTKLLSVYLPFYFPFMPHQSTSTTTDEGQLHVPIALRHSMQQTEETDQLFVETERGRTPVEV